MANYEKVCAYRLPVPESVFEKVGSRDFNDLYEYFSDLLEDSWYVVSGDFTGFSLRKTSEGVYLDYVVECKLAYVDSDYDGFIKEMAFAEVLPKGYKAEVIELFDQCGFDYNVDDIRLVYFVQVIERDTAIDCYNPVEPDFWDFWPDMC